MLLVPWSVRAQPVATPPPAIVAPWGASAGPDGLPPPPGATVAASPLGAQPDAVARHRRLLDVLAWEEERQRLQRRTVLITGSVVGGISLALGIGLSTRDRSSDETAGAFVGALGVGTLLGVGLGALLPTAWSPVLDARDAAATEHLAPAEATARIESAWRTAAERNARAQRVGAWVFIVLGAATGLGGTGLLLSDPLDGVGRSGQRALGTTFVFAGSVLAITGAALMHSLDPVEHGWEVYHRSAPSLGVAPLADGAAATVSGTF